MTNEIIRVGRWMGEAEYNLMVATGYVQISKGKGPTNVLYPSDQSGYKNSGSNTRYVEFDIKKSSLHAWNRTPPPNDAKIHPPTSSIGIALGIKTMPKCKNLIILALKI